MTKTKTKKVPVAGLPAMGIVREVNISDLFPHAEIRKVYPVNDFEVDRMVDNLSETDSIGCTDSTYNYINNQLHVDLGKDTLIYTNQPLSLTSQTFFYYYTWSDNSTANSFQINSSNAGLQTIWGTAIDYGEC